MDFARWKRKSTLGMCLLNCETSFATDQKHEYTERHCFMKMQGSLGENGKKKKKKNLYENKRAVTLLSNNASRR